MTAIALRDLRRRLARRIDPEGARLADNLCRHLDRLGVDLYEDRYTSRGLGSCCYQAVIDYREHQGDPFGITGEHSDPNRVTEAQKAEMRDLRDYARSELARLRRMANGS